MRQLGEDGAQLKDGRASPDWYAGSQPLNGQAVRDLLSDGWLRPVEVNSGKVRIEAWPNFATVELQGAELLKTAASEEAPSPVAVRHVGGACVRTRAAFAIGRLVRARAETTWLAQDRNTHTHTRADEDGTSLRAAGWSLEARVRGRGWHGGKRARSNTNAWIEKVRWGEVLNNAAMPRTEPLATCRQKNGLPTEAVKFREETSAGLIEPRQTLSTTSRRVAPLHSGQHTNR